MAPPPAAVVPEDEPALQLTPNPPPAAAEKARRPRNGRDAVLETEARALVRSLPDCAALADRVEVHWNSRMRSTAGRAWSQAAKVELNPLLLACPEGELDRTLRHELAHLVAHHRAARAQRRRIQPHGPEWHEACADLGIAGEERTHRLEALQARRLARKYHYRCPSCGREFPRVRPIRRPLACAPCCKRWNGGRYDARFRLVVA